MAEFKQATPILEVAGVSKSYPGVRALIDVSLHIKAGEVHGIVGENGAGKSTLIKLVTGAVPADAGTVKVNGTPIEAANPAASLEAGISTIYQEFSLFPELTVGENLFYGRFPKRGIFIDRDAINHQSNMFLKRVGADVSPDSTVKSLSVGQQQLVEIAKALSRNARVVIMDEPTAPLTSHEVRKLYDAIARLRDEGVAIVYISHRLEEIFDLCDRVSVMRDGQLVATKGIDDTDREDLIKLMVGRSLSQGFERSETELGGVVLAVKNISSSKVKNVSFEVREGEIFGLGGLIGSGRTEVARLIFGADRMDTGTILIDGVERKLRGPRDAIRAGVGLIPEDRKHHGALLGHSVRFNVGYASLRSLSRFGIVQRNQEHAAAERFRKALRIRTPSGDQLVKNLSGGNQQKVVLAKWLLTKPRLIIFDEPTRGIDVGAKQEIYDLIRELAANGAAILLISSEMPELLGLSDRIGVLHEGRLTSVLERKEFSQEAILHFASGYTSKEMNTHAPA